MPEPLPARDRGSDARPICIAMIDSEAICSALGRYFEGTGRAAVVASGRAPADADPLIAQHAPDVLLIDPAHQAPDLFGALHERHPGVRLVVFTSPEVFAEFDPLGTAADGFIAKDEPPEHLLEMIARVTRGEVVFSPIAARWAALRQDCPLPPTPRC